MPSETKPSPAEYQPVDPPIHRHLLPPIPVWLVVAAAIAAAVVIQRMDSLDGAQGNLLVLILAFVAFVTLGVWFVFFSGYPPWLRGSLVAVGVVAVVAGSISLRIDGTSGQLVPRFAWRFAPKPDEILGRPKPLDAGGRVRPLVDMETTTADDFPRFLGPAATGAIELPRLALDWSESAPVLLWKERIGAGWSSFSAVNGFAVTMEQRGPLEMVVCYDVPTGGMLWTQSIEARYETVMAGVGPRATPTIHEGRVYTLGAKGRLQCLDGATGNVIWSRSVPADCGVSAAEDAQNLLYGRSNSPLILEDKLVIPGGGPTTGPRHSLLAYQLDTGQILWKGGDRQAAYASPILATLAGTRQILIVNEDNVSSHDPGSGERLWQYDWPGGSSGFANVSQPAPVDGDRVLLSNGYNNGAALLQITYSGLDGWRAEKIWHRKTAMRTKFTSALVWKGCVYGLSDGILECLALDSGQRRWKKGRFGHGQILRVGSALLIQAENGDLVLVELSPDELIERGRVAALQGKTWNNLCLYGNLLLVRNAVEAACFELPLAPAPASAASDL